MKKFSKLGKTLSFVLLFGAMWLIYTVLVFSFEDADNNNTAYIPENSTSVYRLDGRMLTKELLASLLISDDEDLRELAREQIPTSEEGTLKPVGILFDSDIILFRLEEDGHKYSGILFNLWDQRLFNKNIPKYLNGNSAAYSQEDVGLVLLQVDGKLSKSALKKRARKLLSRKTKFRDKNPAPGEKSLISVWYQEGNSFISTIGLRVQDNQLLLNGKLETNEEFSSLKLDQYDGGFHIHSKWFPKSLSGAIESTLASVGFEIPAIKQFSLNYFGATIITEPSVAGLPHMVGSFEFEERISVDSLFKQFELVSRDSIANKSTYAIFGGEYEIIQANEFTLSIRSKEDLEVTQTSKSTTAEISGSPHYLLKLDGDDFIRKILQVTNEYRAVSAFINIITELDVKMTPTSESGFLINGKIALNDEKWPLNELLKFLVRSKLL